MSNACPVCGNEERGQGGYLSCECPAPIDPVLAALKAAERAIDDCQTYRSHLHHKELAQVRAAIASYTAAPVELDKAAADALSSSPAAEPVATAHDDFKMPSALKPVQSFTSDGTCVPASVIPTVELDALRRERDEARAELVELRGLNDWQDTTVYNEERSQLYGKVAWLEHESKALHEVLHAVAAALNVTLRDTPSVNGLLFIEDAQRLPATLTRVTAERDEAVRLLREARAHIAAYYPFTGGVGASPAINDIDAFLSRKDTDNDAD